MSHQCNDHPFEPAAGQCLTCGAHFCRECLIENDRSYPRCKDCSLAVAGIRRHAGRQPVLPPRELKRLRKEWKRGRHGSDSTRAEPVDAPASAEGLFVPLDLDRWSSQPSPATATAAERGGSGSDRGASSVATEVPPDGPRLTPDRDAPDDPDDAALGPGLLSPLPPASAEPPAASSRLTDAGDGRSAEPLHAWDRIRRPRSDDHEGLPSPARWQHPTSAPSAPVPTDPPTGPPEPSPAPTTPLLRDRPSGGRPGAPRREAPEPPEPREAPPADLAPKVPTPTVPDMVPPMPEAEPPRPTRTRAKGAQRSKGSKAKGGSSLFGRGDEDQVRRAAVDEDDPALPSAAELVASLARRQAAKDDGSGSDQGPPDDTEPASEPSRFDPGRVVVEEVDAAPPARAATPTAQAASDPGPEPDPGLPRYDRARIVVEDLA